MRPAQEKRVKAVFGDTFYWIALTLSNEAFPIDILFPRQQITDEVLTESLTFFSGSAERMRRQAATNVEAMLVDPSVRVIPQSGAHVAARCPRIAGHRAYQRAPSGSTTTLRE